MLTPDLAIIVEAMRGSATTELSANGLALRPREGATQWVLPAKQRDAPSAYHQVATSAAAAPAAAAAAQAAALYSPRDSAVTAAATSAEGAAAAAPGDPPAAAGQAAPASSEQTGDPPATPAAQQSRQQGNGDAPDAATSGSGASDPPAAGAGAASGLSTPAHAERRKADDELHEDDMFQLDEVRSVKFYVGACHASCRALLVGSVVSRMAEIVARWSDPVSPPICLQLQSRISLPVSEAVQTFNLARWPVAGAREGR